jgi:hypothetical protein
MRGVTNKKGRVTILKAFSGDLTREEIGLKDFLINKL